ncbi:hypothetical protein ACW9H0_15965, partial [Pseudomonas monsensis]
KTVHHVSEHVSTMSPVHTPGEGQGEGLLIFAPMSGNPLIKPNLSAISRSLNPVTPSKPALPPLAQLLLQPPQAAFRRAPQKQLNEGSFNG